MQESSLFLLLQSFSKVEIRAFRKFLASPYFNQRKDVEQLFEYLIDNQAFVPTRVEVFQHLFPQKEFSEQGLRYIMSYLMQLCKQFLIIEQLHTKSSIRQQYLTQSLRQKGLSKLFEKEWKVGHKQLKKRALRNATYYDHTYWWLQEQFEYIQAKRRQGDLQLQEMEEVLTVTYVIRLLKLANTMSVVQRIDKRNYALRLLPAIIDKIEGGAFANIPAIQVFYYSYLALSNPKKEQHFFTFSKLLAEHTDKFTTEEASDLYRLAISFCIRQFNGGQENYATQALDLYQKGLENRVFLQNGVLSRFTYNNIVQLGLRLQQFAWVLQFINTYQKMLPSKERVNTFTYNLAIYHYRQQNYDQVLDLLQQTQFSDSLYNLDARRMLVRIYFERKEFTALESHLDSFRVYLHRLTNIGYYREIYLNLIRFMRKILNLAPNNQTARIALREEIIKAKVVAEREWLLEIIEKKS